MIVVYLRNVGTEEDMCWVACSKRDPGAVAFEGFPPGATDPAFVKDQAHRERVERGPAVTLEGRGGAT